MHAYVALASSNNFQKYFSYFFYGKLPFILLLFGLLIVFLFLIKRNVISTTFSQQILRGELLFVITNKGRK